MRLIVEDQRKRFDQQTHAYAEYRAFSNLVGNDKSVGDVTVTLAHEPADGSDVDAMVVCTIVVKMPSGDVTEVQGAARHAYAAIDKAVSLIRQTNQRRAAQQVRTQTAAIDRERDSG
jgi:ribosome-associated translation inhibitor RaiA